MRKYVKHMQMVTGSRSQRGPTHDPAPLLSEPRKRANLRSVGKNRVMVPYRAYPPQSSDDGEWWTVLYGDDQYGLQEVNLLVHWDDGRVEVRELRMRGQSLKAEELREVPLGFLVRTIQHHKDAENVWPPEPIMNARGADRGEFTERVAEHYRYHAARTSAPAKAIAEAHGVPVTTVHRWIREARQLGKLPPGRQGRVG